MNWNDSTAWLLFGLLGNLVFSSRFLVQWIASERARASVVPPVFWHLSLVGSIVLLAYALHRRDPVFVLAYLPNGFVYVRNLMLIRRDPAGHALHGSRPRGAVWRSSTPPKASAPGAARLDPRLR